MRHEGASKGRVSQGAFCVKLTPKIRDCMPTFIINYIMIFETPRRRSTNFCAGSALWRVSLCIVSNLSCRIFDPRVFPKFHPFLALRHKSRFSFGKFVHGKRKSLSYQRDWLCFLAEFLVLPCLNIFGWWKASVRAWHMSLDRMTRPRMCASKALPDFD